MNKTAGRRRIRFEDLPVALATLIRTSIRNREAAGRMPGLLSALRKAGGPASAADELLVLHLAAIDIALQVDGRFNGLVHRTILGKTAHVLVAEGGPADRLLAAENGGRPAAENGGGPAAEGSSPAESGLHEALRTRLPVYLEWMYDFVSAQLDGELQEPRDVLGLDDPTDSAVVIVALGELMSACHGTLSRWDLVSDREVM